MAAGDRPTSPPARAFEPQGLLSRLAPFAGVGLVALALVVLPPAPTNVAALVIAVAGTVTLLIAATLTPWARLPDWADAVPPVLYLALVACYREAEGGAQSGYGWLVLVAVFWVALYGTPRQLAVVLAGVGLVFALPVLVAGEPHYPSTELRRALLAVVVSGTGGFVLQRMVRESVRQAERARLKAEALRLSEDSVATVARELTSGPDARAQICRAALSVARADFAVLREPAADGTFVTTATTGLDLPPNPVSLEQEPSGPGLAYATGRRIFLADVRTDPLASRRLTEASGAASVLSEPVLLGARSIGVLVMGWKQPVTGIEDLPLSTIELLAAEAAVAIEHDRMQAEVEALARTDALTGLANRRVWDEELPRELARAGRYGQPVAVAILDLDRFKDFNDEHGHQAGDRLLQDVAAAWAEQLRDVDLLARYGGEEFAVLLPNSTLEEAEEAIERVRRATPRDQQTCSAGVAAWDGVEQADALFARADRALYAAKRAGRDRTTVDRASRLA